MFTDTFNANIVFNRERDSNREYVGTANHKFYQPLLKPVLFLHTKSYTKIKRQERDFSSEKKYKQEQKRLDTRMHAHI